MAACRGLHLAPQGSLEAGAAVHPVVILAVGAALDAAAGQAAMNIRAVEMADLAAAAGLAGLPAEKLGMAGLEVVAQAAARQARPPE